MHFYFLLRHLESGKRNHFIYAAMTVIPPILTRYIGYSLVGIFTIYIFLWSFYKERKFNLKELVEHLAILAVVSIPHFLWLYRNYVDKKQTLHGKRRPSKIPFEENVSDLVNTLIDQLTYTPILWLIISSGFICFLHTLWKTKKWDTHSLFVLYLYSYVGLYVGLLLYSTSTVHLDRISPRFTTPILLPLLLTIPYLGHSIAQTSFLPFAPKIKGNHILMGALVISLLGGLYNSKPIIDKHFLHVRPTKHSIAYGFESSNTAERLHDILAQYINNSDDEKIVVSSIIKTRHSGQGYVFMTRKNLWDGDSFSFNGYADFPNTSSLIIEVQNEQKTTEVEHWFYGPLLSPKDFEQMLSKMQIKTNSNEILIFADRRYLSEIGVENGNLENIEMEFYSCKQQKKHAKPFYTYICKGTIDTSTYQDIDALTQHELIVSELMVRPLVAKPRGQWFELYNNSEKDINLMGLVISNGKQDMKIDTPVILSPHSYIVFALRSNTKVNGGIENVGYEYALGKLKFRYGGKIELRNAKDILDSVSYKIGSYSDSNGEGLSIYRNIEDGVLSEWCESTIDYGSGGKGSPGEANETCKVADE